MKKRSPNSSFQLSAPAKINVFLEVHGKRSDGFHELETVMLRTRLCDVMRFEPAETNSVSLHLSELTCPEIRAAFPLDDSNLILRAANALQAATSITQGAKITIEKRIPAQAGLAGGSSNAATALRGLNRLWSLNMPKKDLHAIAARLGSDINFFVEDCRAAVCRGRGEQVTPVDFSGCLHFVAARPREGNSTPEVFSAFSAFPPDRDVRSCRTVTDALRKGCRQDLNNSAFNRLTAAAQSVNTSMADMMKEMSAVCGRPIFMSGSGSTCYAIAHSARDAQRMERRLRNMLAIQPAFLKAVGV